ncbi:Response regulator receiver domain-containing protein [Zhouia amylolytica]|uniref:Response regulator receiver protein n=2 Tax=Zhouia amylolytica TaxID=376730 RepID=W2UPM9_9FLAO|nr:response regulator [Zhouia amylolytica]ETN95899.1 response regulator receiver protein [Zhouia amylolytica AD3]MCQ0111976.1 response regulator [Zhouia amylolytica]SFS53702.1 Response regulator receiver domain-containing protein [Zhouia amylolytica]
MRSEQNESKGLRKVLLVEDNTLTKKILEHILKKEGYQYRIANDGNEGIAAIAEFNPDIIITDIMLPVKNGLEVVVYAKRNFTHIPIIVLSALGEEEGAVTRAFNLGADDFVPKPFNPGELVLRIKRLLAKINNTTNS